MNASPHPVKAALVMRGTSFVEVARKLSYSEQWVRRCINAEVRVPARFKRQLSELLGIPEAELFHAEPESVSA